MNSRYITKSELAIALVITKRTLTTYTKTGLLPTPTHRGRDVGWTVDELQASLQVVQGNEVHLAEEKRQRLHRALTEWASVNPVAQKHSRLILTNHQLPEPVVVDDNYHHERDQRGPCIEKVKRERAVLAIVHQEIRNTKSGSFEQHEGWKERHFVQDNIDTEEAFLKENFVPLHSKDQLISTSELLVSPLFNIRNHKEPRHNSISISLSLAGNGLFSYEGPELRQDAYQNAGNVVELKKAIDAKLS